MDGKGNHPEGGNEEGVQGSHGKANGLNGGSSAQLPIYKRGRAYFVGEQIFHPDFGMGTVEKVQSLSMHVKFGRRVIGLVTFPPPKKRDS